MHKEYQKHAASLISGAYTPANQLRQILNNIEIILGKIQIITVDESRSLPFLLDEATQLLEALDVDGANVASEKTRYASVCAEYKRKGSQILKAIGGRDELERMRNKVIPSPKHWWWYIDAYLDEKAQIRRKKTIRTSLIFAGLMTILVVLYLLFLAPDKATRERFIIENNAEQALAQGFYDDALEILEPAVSLYPGNPDLLMLYGVAAQLTNNTEIAEITFTQVRQILENDEDFYYTRAQIFLNAGLAEYAAEDAERILEINPESAIGYYQKGTAANALGDIRTAYLALENAAKYANKEGKIELEGMARIQLAYLSTTFTDSQPTETPDN